MVLVLFLQVLLRYLKFWQVANLNNFIFFKNFIGNLLTRSSALTIVVIMICAFYLAHKDWFINEKLFTSEQIFLFVIGIYFLINGNEDFKKKVFKN